MFHERRRQRWLLAVVSAACTALLVTVLTSSALSGGRAAQSESQQPLKGKTVWYLDVLGTNPTVNGNAQGLNNVITKAGGKLIRAFALNSAGQVDISVEAQAFDRALASNPAAIVMFVLDPKALKPQVKRAKAAGVPVFAMVGKPEGYTVNAYLTPPDCRQGQILAHALASQLPKGSEWTELASAVIVSNEIQLNCAERVMKKAGMKFVGSRNNQRNLTDIATGAIPIMQGILQKYPNLKGLYSFNDDSAVGVTSAIRAAGKRGKIVVVARNGSDLGVALVKKGDLYATCDFNPIGLGQTIGRAVIAHLSGTKKYTNSARLTPPDPSNCLVTKKNVNKYVPWTKRVKQVKIPEG
jgi:ribose transport system substrate-binding protein